MRVFDLLKNRIEKMEEKRDIDGLILALQDEDREIRRQSAHVLGKLGSKEAVPYLIKTLQDPDKEVEEEAITALGKIKDPKAIPGLVKNLNNPQTVIRWRSAQALGKIGSKKALQPLIRALHDPDTEVEEEVITALGKIKDPDATPTLIKTLNNPRTSIRWRAAQALGKIGSTEAIEPLTQALHDPDKEVREETENALGKIAIKPLLEDLKSNEIVIKEEAIIKINRVPQLKNLSGSKHDSKIEITEKSKSEGETDKKREADERQEQDESVKPFKTSSVLTDFKERKELLLKEGYYTFIQNFVRKSRYNYMEDFSCKTDYDYQLKDLQKLKDLLEYKGVKFQDQEMLWLIREEIKEGEYQEFKNKMLKSQSSTRNQFLQSYITIFRVEQSQENPENLDNLDNLKRLLEENQLPTKNLKTQIQEILKERELEEFEDQLLRIPLKNYSEKISPTILKEFIKKDLNDKRDSLISSEDYHYIENFVRKSKYDYRFFDVQKFKSLIKQKGKNFQDEELVWFIQEEIKEQDYQDFKDQVLENQPSTPEEYLKNYIKSGSVENLEDPQNLENLQKLLREEKMPTNNLEKQIEQTLKQKELEEFENEIMHQSSSQTIPPLESRVAEDKALKKAQILHNLGNLFYDLERPDEALKYYNKSIDTYPEIIESWKNKGLLLYVMGRPQEAMACYNHILTLDPDYREVWLDIGLILYEMGKLHEAKFCYDKAQKMESPAKEIGSDTRQFLKRTPFYQNIFQSYLDLVSSERGPSSDSLSPISRILEMINQPHLEN